MATGRQSDSEPPGPATTHFALAVDLSRLPSGGSHRFSQDRPAPQGFALHVLTSRRHSSSGIPVIPRLLLKSLVKSPRSITWVVPLRVRCSNQRDVYEYKPQRHNTPSPLPTSRHVSLTASVSWLAVAVTRLSSYNTRNWIWRGVEQNAEDQCLQRW
jgi:hypothetical protein